MSINFNELESFKITKQTNKSIKLELWFNQNQDNVLGMAQLLAEIEGNVIFIMPTPAPVGN